MLQTDPPTASYAGDYFVWMQGDPEDAMPLLVRRIRSFDERILVFVKQEQLYAEHTFYFLWVKFLTLHYTIERKVSAPTPLADVRELVSRAPSLQRSSRKRKP